MRVLVTGGSGYIGTQTVRALLEAGHEPVIFDLKTPPSPTAGSVAWVHGDVRDRQALDATFRDRAFDAVIHLAAEKSIAASLADPDRFMDVNVAGTERVAEAAIDGGAGVFVFSSSCAVYGNPEHLPVDESTPRRPVSPYGLSKLRAEAVLAEATARGSLRSLSLRYFNAAGAAPDARSGEDWRGAVNLLPVAIEAALGRRPAIEVFGDDHPTPDGTAIRDYVHVTDLAAAHVTALDALARAVPVPAALNLGTGRGTSVRDLLDEVGRVVGRAVPHTVVPRRAGEASAVWADPGLAAVELGWQARAGLGEIVASAVAWHRASADAGRGVE